MEVPLTVGDIARLSGRSQSTIRKTVDRLNISARIGVYRVVRKEDVDKVLKNLPAAKPTNSGASA